MPRPIMSSRPETGVWSSPFRGPWLALRYRPTSLWSLKSSGATSSGAKSLLVPTSYSIKLALIDAAIKAGQVSDGERLFELLRGRPLRIRPPAAAVVSAAFVRVWKGDVCPDRAKGESEQQYDVRVRNKFGDYCPRVGASTVGAAALEDLKRMLRQTFAPTVGFREYVQFGGEADLGVFEILISVVGLKSDDRILLARGAAACTYSGKRGCFLQFLPADTHDGLMEVPDIATDAPYTLPYSVWRSMGGAVRLGSLQVLDELTATAEWDRVSTYGSGQVHAASESEVRLGERRSRFDRVFVDTLIPYRLMGSSKGYSVYRRTDLA